MIHMRVIIILFALLSCTTAFGQTSYKGLTPGQSTRADAERVLGRHVKEVSQTLVGYESPEGIGHLFVQYRDATPAAIIEAVTLTCVSDECYSAPFVEKFDPLCKVLEDVFTLPKSGAPTFARYYGAPRFTVVTFIGKPGVSASGKYENFEERLGFYSKELYESAVPKSGCTGTIFGTWETDRGRVVISRVGDSGISGTYSKNNGTFNLRPDKYDISLTLSLHNGLVGEWRDNTGSGTMALLLDGDTFNATWAGPGAVVPPNNKQAKRPARESPKAEVENEADRLSAELDALHKQSIEAGATPSDPTLRDKGLPPGQPWKGKCVP